MYQFTVKINYQSMKAVCSLFIFFTLISPKDFLAQNNLRPYSNNINIYTLKWLRTYDSNFQLFYKPNGYAYNLGQDYRYFSLENGDKVAYCLITTCYWQLSNFYYAPKNAEMDISLVSCSESVFIRSSGGGFWILDRGINVVGLQFIQYNPDGTAVYWSTSTGKKYWIPNNIFSYGSFSKPYKIISE